MRSMRAMTPGSPPKQAPNTVPEKTTSQIISARFAEKGRTGPCAMCGHVNEWQVGGFVPHIVSESPTEIKLGGRLYPLIAVYCRNCGNTHLVNLINLGFTRDEIAEMKLPLPEEPPKDG